MSNESMTAIDIVGIIFSTLAIINMVLIIFVSANSILLSKTFRERYLPFGLLYAAIHLTFQMAFSQGLFKGMGG